MAQSLIITLGSSFTDPDLPSLQRDEVIVNGTLCCYDLARSYTWAGGDPVDDSVVQDLTYANRHASVQIDGGSIAYLGGGFDFTGATDSDAAMIKIPASVFAELWGGSQYWLAVAYIKLPTFIDWNASGNIKTFIDTAGVSAINGAPALFAFGQATTGMSGFRKKTTVNQYDYFEISHASLTNFYGTVTQVAMWRESDNITFRLKNADDVRSATLGAGATNDSDFSGTYGSAGVGEASLLRPTGNRQKFRVHRIFIEDLEVSGRDPATVLDSDWARTEERAVFS
jgi:hypothetical protein